jgi:dihydrofolate reductase
MRKVTFGGANSLDNFIARKDDAVDWLMFNKEVAALMEDYWKNIDTVLMGRRTYEVALKNSGGGGDGGGYNTSRKKSTARGSPDSPNERIACLRTS